MIVSNATTQNSFENRIFLCLTYVSSKLGPRLVGNVSEWQLDDFSKDVLYSIIHDSLMMRTKRTMLCVKNLFGESYRVYVLKCTRKFFDYRYQGDEFAFCFFVPSNFSGRISIDENLEDFEWEQLITSKGTLEELIPKLKKKVTIIS